MLTQQIIAFVRQQRMGYVATTNPDGSPNLSPKGTLTALDEKKLVFANIASPKTLRNLQSNSRADVNVLDIFIRKGYRFICTAKVINNENKTEFEKLLQFYHQIDLDLSRYAFREFILLPVLDYEELLSPAYYLGDQEDELKSFYLKH